MQCKQCAGTGYNEPECDTCESNRGWVDDEEFGGTKICPDCAGDSDVICEECDGTGE